MPNNIEKILLLCIGNFSTHDKMRQLAQVTEDEWGLVTELAKSQKILTLFYYNFKNLGLALPAGKLQQLKQILILNAGRNLRFYRELNPLLRRMNARGVPVIVMKGIYLAEAVYENIGLRTMVDIDLLVKEADVAVLDEELLALGYHPHEFSRVIGPDCHHFSYDLPEKQLLLEIHWTIIPQKFSFKIDTNGLWQRAQAVNIGGAPAYTLSLEDLVLHLCLHTAKHGSELGIRMLCDLVVLFQRFGENLDWDVLVERARQWNAVRAVYVILRLSRELLGATIPDQTLEALKPLDLNEKFVELAREQMLFDHSVQFVDSDLMNLSKMAGSTSFGKKLSVLRHALFPPKGMIAREYRVPIDSWRLYLYYPLRIADIISRTMFELKKLSAQRSKNQTDRHLLIQLSDMSDWLMSE